ncbi:MAG: zf-HC2 domain-containing protein [candidate division KSB1 bacterium]|nr:zf-HC2 domain-containing protein [candidate division KSB1 bacterium]
MNCEQSRSLMMDYLYDELADEDRQLLEAHVTNCRSCHQELAALRQTSAILQQWEDADPDFHLVMVAPKISFMERLKELLSVPRRRLARFALGAALALMIAFIVLAIANTEISYRSGEFSFRISLLPRAVPPSTVDTMMTVHTIDRAEQ